METRIKGPKHTGDRFVETSRSWNIVIEKHRVFPAQDSNTLTRDWQKPGVRWQNLQVCISISRKVEKWGYQKTYEAHTYVGQS